MTDENSHFQTQLRVQVESEADGPWVRTVTAQKTREYHANPEGKL